MNEYRLISLLLNSEIGRMMSYMFVVRAYSRLSSEGELRAEWAEAAETMLEAIQADKIERSR